MSASQDTAKGGRGVNDPFQRAGFVINNAYLPINSATLVEVVCALTGFVSVYGGYHLPRPMRTSTAGTQLGNLTVSPTFRK